MKKIGVLGLMAALAVTGAVAFIFSGFILQILFVFVTFDDVAGFAKLSRLLHNLFICPGKSEISRIRGD